MSVSTGLYGTWEGDACELLLLHIDASSSQSLSGEGVSTPLPAQSDSCMADGARIGDIDMRKMWLEWIDDFLGALNKREGFNESVLTTVILGDLDVKSQPGLQLGSKSDAINSTYPCLFGTNIRPVQSCEISGNKQIAVCECRNLVIARRLQGVVRIDDVKVISGAHVGSAGAILVEHVLPEIAYKLARSKKYGA